MVSPASRNYKVHILIPESDQDEQEIYRVYAYIRYGYVGVAPDPALKLYQPLLAAPEPLRHNKIHDRNQFR